MIIKCNDTRNIICDWLASLAITYDTQARLAEHKSVQREMRIKSDTIAAAAKFIRETGIGAMKKPCPLAYDIKATACHNNHVHIIMLDQDGKEICEFQLSDIAEYNSFVTFLAATAVDAFMEDRGTLQ